MRSTRLIAVAAVVALVAFGTRSQGARAQAPEPGRSPTIATFRGSHNSFSTAKVEGPVFLHAGVVVLHARHGGNSNFSAYLVTADPGKAPEDSYDNRYLLINSIGRFDGAAAEALRQDGEYYILIGAGGSYEFRVEQPLPDNVAAPLDQRSFSGEHQQVTPVFRLPAGTHTVHATSDGTSNFQVWLYQIDDLGGGAIDGDYAGRLLNVGNGPADEAVKVTLRRPGLFLVHAFASSLQTPYTNANWTVRIE